MDQEKKSLVLSFGEIYQPHDCLTIAYAGYRFKSKDLYNKILPTEAYLYCISRLEEIAKNNNADGIKNIDVKWNTSHDENGEEVIDFMAQGTLFKFK